MKDKRRTQESFRTIYSTYTLIKGRTDLAYKSNKDNKTDKYITMHWARQPIQKHL